MNIILMKYNINWRCSTPCGNIGSMVVNNKNLYERLYHSPEVLLDSGFLAYSINEKKYLNNFVYSK